MEMTQKTEDGRYTMVSYVELDADEGVEPLRIYTKTEEKTFCVEWNKKGSFIYHEKVGDAWDEFYCMTCWGPNGAGNLTQDEAIMYALEGSFRAAQELELLLEGVA
jgi:hypothetical protein